MKCTAIILAAGQGKRMKTKVQKQFLMLQGKPLLYYSLSCFQKSNEINEIVVVTGKDSIDYCRNEIIEKYEFTKVKCITEGGKERYDSVYAGLEACSADTDYVFIHDGARPFITEDIIKRTKEGAIAYGACIAGVPSKDTMKIIDENNMVSQTLDRSKVWCVQTPQVFLYHLIKEAHDNAKHVNMQEITDDAMVVERYKNTQVHIVEGAYDNIKITTPEDLLVAEKILKKIL